MLGAIGKAYLGQALPWLFGDAAAAASNCQCAGVRQTRSRSGWLLAAVIAAMALGTLEAGISKDLRLPDQMC